MTNSEAGRPSDVLAVRIRAVRKKRGLTVPQLADRCASIGFPLTAQTIYNIEGRRSGKRTARPVTVDELFAIAKALQVFPIDLMTQPDEREVPYAVTPEVTAPVLHVRDWIRGRGFLPGDQRQLYLTEIPADEFEEIGGLMFGIEPWQRPFYGQGEEPR